MDREWRLCCSIATETLGSLRKKFSRNRLRVRHKQIACKRGPTPAAPVTDMDSFHLQDTLVLFRTCRQYHGDHGVSCYSLQLTGSQVQRRGEDDTALPLKLGQAFVEFVLKLAVANRLGSHSHLPQQLLQTPKRSDDGSFEDVC